MKVVSGGQTGVDRGALEAAIALGIPHGGWCPRGRRAEDGRIPDRYQLRESASPDYAVRTEQNVCDSDATLILHTGQITGGTERTLRLAEQHQKPHLVVNLNRPLPVEEVQQWLQKEQIKVLNVAGPRESQNPGIAAQATAFLRQVLQEIGRL